MKTQQNNKKSNIIIEDNGELLTAKEFSEKHNMPYSTVKSRYERGLDLINPEYKLRYDAHILTMNGESHHAAEWARIVGIDAGTILRRIKLGWSDERALTVPVKEQHSREITFGGETHTLAEWSKIVGIKDATLRGRLKKGWTIEEALKTPVGQRGVLNV